MQSKIIAHFTFWNETIIADLDHDLFANVEFEHSSHKTGTISILGLQFTRGHVVLQDHIQGLMTPAEHRVNQGLYVRHLRLKRDLAVYVVESWSLNFKTIWWFVRDVVDKRIAWIDVPVKNISSKTWKIK